MTLVRSKIGIKPKHKKILEVLCLNKINSFVIKNNDKSVLRMVFKIKHLVDIKNIN
ncbi:MAG: 50S ribosomal protein L30 [Clostridiales bacterium]|nr:50S ribosomal protein L30 [Clostridiales bacterium]